MINMRTMKLLQLYNEVANFGLQDCEVLSVLSFYHSKVWLYVSFHTNYSKTSTYIEVIQCREVIRACVHHDGQAMCLRPRWIVAFATKLHRQSIEFEWIFRFHFRLQLLENFKFQLVMEIEANFVNFINVLSMNLNFSTSCLPRKYPRVKLKSFSSFPMPTKSPNCEPRTSPKISCRNPSFLIRTWYFWSSPSYSDGSTSKWICKEN